MGFKPETNSVELNYIRLEIDLVPFEMGITCQGLIDLAVFEHGITKRIRLADIFRIEDLILSLELLRSKLSKELLCRILSSNGS
ncbi:MAG: hypothetical protein KAX05_04955 [Bacteroidales bacterium]|nr:hypothetical protein [Bacteroidales bacterium]